MAIPDPAITNWVPIWNPLTAGPVGPQGPTGATGPQGPAGTSIFNETGTWNPGLRASDGGIATAYNFRSGFYSRVDRLCYCHFDMGITSASWGSGLALFFTGLPFISNGFVISHMGACLFYTLNGNFYTVAPFIYYDSSEGDFRFKNTFSPSVDGALLTSNIPSGARFIGSFAYVTAA